MGGKPRSKAPKRRRLSAKEKAALTPLAQGLLYVAATTLCQAAVKAAELAARFAELAQEQSIKSGRPERARACGMFRAMMASAIVQLDSVQEESKPAQPTS